VERPVTFGVGLLEKVTRKADIIKTFAGIH
jgi:hypothetical protein